VAGFSIRRVPATGAFWHADCIFVDALGGNGHEMEPTMLPSTRFAYFTLSRDAGFVTLAGALMMVGASFEPALAFDIGATVALLFSLVLVARAWRLTEERFRHSEAWTALRPEERPGGEQGLVLARAHMSELLLRFAKGAAGIAGILYGSALAVSVGSVAHAGM
jgi:hypothetical protein